MGFDVSFHPIDAKLVNQRVTPFVRGQGNIDDLVARAARIARTRIRAKHWAAGLLAHRLREFAVTDPDDSLTGIPLSIRDDRFDEDLHIWGRPFFICDELSSGAVDSYELYLDIEESDVDAIARRMIALVDPALSGLIECDLGEHQISDHRLIWEISWKLNLFRDAFYAYSRNQPVTLTAEISVDPNELFAAEFTPTVIAFMASLTPGWMARGYSWPSHLLARFAPKHLALFDTAACLFSPFLGDFPEIAGQFGDTLGAGHRIGGYVESHNVPALRAALLDVVPNILDAAADSGWLIECKNDLTKIDETLLYCQRHHQSFLEVSDLYSASFGVVN